MGRDKIKSPEIDGFVYEVTQLPAKQGEKAGAEIIAMIVPLIGAFAGEGKASGERPKSIADFDLRTLGIKAAADVFAEKLLSPQLTAIREQMAEHTEIYGEGFGDAGAPMSRNYDEHFAGRYDAMLEWFLFALEVNFGGFLEGAWRRVKSRFPVLHDLSGALSSLQGGSTGESGA